jgi:hypothetical protein
MRLALAGLPCENLMSGPCLRPLNPSMTTPMAETSVSLLERLCLEPTEDAWKRFVGLYAPLIRGWLKCYQVKDEDAEDLGQEVMAVVVRELAHFRHNSQCGAIRTWLSTVTVNQLRLLWRTRRGLDAATGNSAMAQMLDLTGFFSDRICRTAHSTIRVG